jgi:hypothetical protein
VDDRYREIYGALYVARTSDVGDTFGLRSIGGSRKSAESREWGDTVRNAVEAAQVSARRRLREDAKALLAVNFLDLVVQPLIVGGKRNYQLPEDVHADIVMLATDVSEQANRSDTAETADSEISAHEIIDSLSRNWERLQISRWQLWEQD